MTANWKTWGYVIIAALTVLFLVLKLYFPTVKDDGPTEEFIESVIEETTGVQADLTPSSPEVK
jgi:hypothetical protein